MSVLLSEQVGVSVRIEVEYGVRPWENEGYEYSLYLVTDGKSELLGVKPPPDEPISEVLLAEWIREEFAHCKSSFENWPERLAKGISQKLESQPILIRARQRQEEQTRAQKQAPYPSELEPRPTELE